MIKYKKVGKRHLYYYKDRWQSARELFESPECKVSLSALTQRLCMSVSYQDRTNFETVEQCMITDKIKGNGGERIERDPPSHNFIDLMMLMKVNNSKTRVMQSKLVC